MKFFGCFFLFVFFLCAIAALLLLQQKIPKEITQIPPGPPPKTKPQPELTYRPGMALREFQGNDLPDRFRVSYGFIDFLGSPHRISCEISKTDHARESQAFGYDEDELKEALRTELQAYVDDLLAQRDLTGYMKLKIKDWGGYEWNYHLPENMPTEEQIEKLSKINEVAALLKTDYAKKVDTVERRLYKTHGFLLHGDQLRIDYAPIVLRNITTLHNCFESIERSAPNYQNQDLIGLYLAFFQEIRYELPPDKIDKREIMGLYVPTEVVIHDHGDCDSKSLAFSAMIRSLKIPLIVIRVPGHVLVGVESRPGPNQKFVRLGNRYFVLCEVAGPAKLFPGEEGSTRVQGNFEYTLIEPA